MRPLVSVRAWLVGPGEHAIRGAPVASTAPDVRLRVAVSTVPRRAIASREFAIARALLDGMERSVSLRALRQLLGQRVVVRATAATAPPCATGSMARAFVPLDGPGFRALRSVTAAHLVLDARRRADVNMEPSATGSRECVLARPAGMETSARLPARVATMAPDVPSRAAVPMVRRHAIGSPARATARRDGWGTRAPSNATAQCMDPDAPWGADALMAQRRAMRPLVSVSAWLVGPVEHATRRAPVASTAPDVRLRVAVSTVPRRAIASRESVIAQLFLDGMERSVGLRARRQLLGRHVVVRATAATAPPCATGSMARAFVPLDGPGFRALRSVTAAHLVLDARRRADVNMEPSATGSRECVLARPAGMETSARLPARVATMAPDVPSRA
eukprot:Opistho-2@18589